VEGRVFLWARPLEAEGDEAAGRTIAASAPCYSFADVFRREWWLDTNRKANSDMEYDEMRGREGSMGDSGSFSSHMVLNNNKAFRTSATESPFKDM
jgi:hypothetical protein